MSSLDRILPFLRPIEDLIGDPAITEIMVNEGGRSVFVERAGIVQAVVGRALDARNLTVAIKNIARACGDEISDMQPVIDASSGCPFGGTRYSSGSPKSGGLYGVTKLRTDSAKRHGGRRR